MNTALTIIADSAVNLAALADLRDEMTQIERVGYYVNGSAPFDDTGECK